MWRLKPLCEVPCSDFIGRVIWRLMTDRSCCVGLLNMTPATWHQLNAPEWEQYLPPLTHSPSLFLLLSLLSGFCCDDRCCYQRSQMKGGLYPHLCPSLLTPLSLSPPLALISHLSLCLNSEHSHLFSETRGFRTRYQLGSRNHMAASNTRDKNTRNKCFIPVQALARVFPSPTLDSALRVWDSPVSIWYCPPCRDKSINHSSFTQWRKH